jgi:hypothetical protein
MNQKKSLRSGTAGFLTYDADKEFLERCNTLAVTINAVLAGRDFVLNSHAPDRIAGQARGGRNIAVGRLSDGLFDPHHFKDCSAVASHQNTIAGLRTKSYHCEEVLS